MPKPENIEPHKFKKGHKLSNGRPPMLISAICKELEAEGYERVTRSQVEGVYSFLVGLPHERLKAYIEDPKTPMIVRIMGKEMLNPKRGAEIIEIMLSRAHGKPTQKNEVEHSGTINIPAWLGGAEDE